MRASPVGSYPTPAYPQRRSLATTGSGKTGNEATQAGLLVVLIALAAGCGATAPSPALPVSEEIKPMGMAAPPASSVPPPAAEPPAPPVDSAAPVASAVPAAAAQDPAAIAPEPGALSLRPARRIVAPLFERGDGRGAAGCVVVAPPVFMSEEEALTIVGEELAKYGVRLARKGAGIDKTTNDGKLAVEFVSYRDCERLAQCGYNNRRIRSSVTIHDVKGAAADVANRLRSQGGPAAYVVVFYDPVGVAASLSSMVHSTRAPEAPPYTAEEYLRQQVWEFVRWLRSQGA